MIPKLSLSTIVLLSLWALFHVVVFLVVRPNMHLAPLLTAWMLGQTYGFVSGLSWMSTVVDNRWFGYLWQATLVLAASWSVNQFIEENWLRHLSNFGGLVLVQSTLFLWFRVPEWTRENQATRPSRQFSIGNVLIATTVVAMLLAIVQRYDTSIDRWSYWLVLLIFWTVCSGTAASVNWALNGSGKPGIFARTLLSLSCSIGLAIFLAAADSALRGTSLGTVMSLYGTFMTSFVTTVYFFCIAGQRKLVDQPESSS